SVQLNDEFFKKSDEYLHMLQREFSRHEKNDSDSFDNSEIEPVAEIEIQQDSVINEQIESKVEEQADKNIENIFHIEQQEKKIDNPSAITDTSKTEVLHKPDKSLVLDEHVRVSGNLLRGLLNDSDEIGISHNRVEQNLSEFNLLLSDMDETL